MEIHPACTAGNSKPSHVLTAMGRPDELAYGALRLSLSLANTEEELDYLLQVIPKALESLRRMSPVWREKCSGEREFILK